MIYLILCFVEILSLELARKLETIEFHFTILEGHCRETCRMSSTFNSDEDRITTVDFTRIYNKWLDELTSIEDIIMNKANEVQMLQSSLCDEASSLKNLNETLLPIHVKQNYLENYLNTLTKEQEELEKEVSKLDRIENSVSETEEEELADEYPAIMETVEAELGALRDRIRTIVNQINSKYVNFEKSKEPCGVYRTIMDRYTDALQKLDLSSSEIQDRLDKLNTISMDPFA